MKDAALLFVRLGHTHTIVSIHERSILFNNVCVERATVIIITK